MSSLDVPALQTVEELGLHAPHWVLQVDVPVPLFQETTVHEIPEVQVAERPPFISATTVATPEARGTLSLAGTSCVFFFGDVPSCLASATVSGKKEDVARRGCSCIVKWARSAFSDSGKSRMWLAFDCSDGEKGVRVEICLSRVGREVQRCVCRGKMC